MRVKTLLTILVVGLVALAIAIYFATKPPVEPISVQQQVKDQGADYSLGIKYPYFGHINYEAEVNEAVWQFVQDQISGFKKTVSQRNPSGRAVDHKSALYTEYTVAVFNPALIMVRFTVSSYFTGDSHPETTVFVFSYDLENNEMLPVKVSTL